MLSTNRQDRFWSFVWQLNRGYIDAGSQLPPWRHPLVGYLVGLLLVGLGLVGGLVEAQFLSPLSFPGALLTFIVVIVALLWGVVPAIFTMLLSLLVLDYLYVPPFGALGSYGWSGTVQLLTFAATGIVLAILTYQRESARVRSVAVEREAVLRAQQLEATFGAMNDSVVVYSRQGKVLQTNAATRLLFGLSSLTSEKEAQVKQDLLLQAAQRDERGQLLPEKRRPLSRLLKGEKITSTNAADVLINTPDGRKLVLNLSGAPIHNEAGAIERIIIIYRDVTERRRLEQRTLEALRALFAMAETLTQLPDRSSPNDEGDSYSEAGLIGERMVALARSVVESEHVVMFAVDTEKETLRPVASAGFTSSEEQQWRERLTTSPFLEDHFVDLALLSSLREGQVITLDGMTLPLYTHVFPYYVRAVVAAPICVDNKLIGVLCVDAGSREHAYTDHEITLIRTVAGLVALILARAQYQREYAEARANELALHEANRRMEEFLGIICHELKNPITAMYVNVQLAERKMRRLSSSIETSLYGEKRGFAPLLALLEQTKSQIMVQDRLVDDLLDVSRMQWQTLKLLMETCNLATIVQEAVEVQRQMTPARTIHLTMPDQKDVPVYGDADRLVQVVTNYLTNALKYSPADQPIDVTLSVEEGQIARVLVRDRGHGLAEGEHERIWNRFYRVSGIEGHNGSDVGLGVGLYICRTIIEQHSGQVGVQSCPGEGSVFWFTVPLSEYGAGEEAMMGRNGPVKY